MDAADLRSAAAVLASTMPSPPENQPALRLLEDSALAWGRGDEPDVLVVELPEEAAADPLDWVAQQADVLIADYYRNHPLSRAGFQAQAEALIGQHGAAAFAAEPGSLPDCTLFVDLGSVVVETRGAPRHQYGAYCELPGPVGDPAAAAQRWFDSGEAYDQYLSMNVCRYNC